MKLLFQFFKKLKLQTIIKGDAPTSQITSGVTKKEVRMQKTKKKVWIK